ncbi:MAG: glycosyltransferase family 8 protein [Methanobrevibacter sp.]|jgi:lipopolysaccharide biosynthesis glycosyltransferase|nr:glycosyltransferase family 8 protein [Candidatus Methanovirga australis]
MGLNFLFSADDNYSMQMCIAIVSLQENNPDDNKTVYIIDNGISEINLEKILSLRDIYYNLNLVVLDGSLVNHFFHELSLKYGVDYLNSSKMAMFGRIFVGSLIPDNVDRVLYLDCDLIVNSNVSALFDIDLGVNYVGAVLDRITNIVSMNLSLSNVYFNSGVLLINLGKWREDKLEKKILSEIKRQVLNNSRFYDQPILNRVLQGRVKVLPLEYNFFPFFKNEYFFYRVLNDGNFYSLEEFEQIQIPCIVHFYSGCKPWYSNSNVPFRDYFIYYKSISPFKDRSLDVDGRLEKYRFKLWSYFRNFLKNPRLLPLTKYYFIHKFKKFEC